MMKQNDIVLIRQSDGGHGPLTLLLSLNLIMLSFFIMLNTVLHQAGGQASAGDAGLAEEDSGGPGMAGGKGDLPQGNWSQLESGQMLQGELRGLVANSLRLQTADLVQDARGLQLTLPLTPVFKADGRTLSDGGRIWLENLRVLLNGAARGWDVRLLLENGSPVVQAAQVVALQPLLAGRTVDVGFVPGRDTDKAGRMVLTLMAPAGVQTGRRVEQLQRGLVDGERGLGGTSLVPGIGQLHGISGNED